VSVTINAGATSATFPATAGAIASDQTALVTATLNGSSKTASITLTAPVTLSSLVCLPASVTAGASSTCTIALSKSAPAGGLAVMIADNASYLTVPSSVTVAAGATTSAFTATASSVASAQSATIVATASGLSMTAVLTVQPVAAATKPAGLVAAYGFEEGSGYLALDYSGSNNVAAVSGAAWTSGKFGGAVSGDGVNDFVIVPSIDLSGTDAVTVSMWVNRSYSTAGGHTLFESTANYTASTTGFGLFPDDPTCKGIMAGVRGNAGLSINCFAQPSSGVWHHLAAVYSKGNSGRNEVALYVDGASQSPTRRYATANNSNKFGKNSLYLFSRAGFQQFTAGVVDEVRVYNRALSQSEIQTDMNTAVRSYSPSSSGRGRNTTVSMSTEETAEPKAASDASSLSLSCSPRSVAAGSWVRCELQGAPAPDSRSVRLATGTDQLKTPSSVMTRPNQSVVAFYAYAESFARQQSVVIKAELDGATVEETVLVQAAAKPVILAPASQMASTEGGTLFDVAATDAAGAPVELSVKDLPAGATFDAATGRFEWTPQAAQAGKYDVTFVANSAERTSTTRVALEVGSGAPELNASAAPCSVGGLGTVTGKWLVAAGEETKVLVNGQYAPVFRASPSAVDFLCPNAEPGTPLSIQAEIGALRSQPAKGSVQSAAPRILSLAAATEETQTLFAESGEFAASGDPTPAPAAHAGDSVVMLAAGLPACQTATAGVTAFVGGVAAGIESMRPATDAPGVCRVEFQIPKSVAFGDKVAVTLQVVDAGRALASTPLTIPVEAAK
jgi:uncharacterized protein (TIGR03437 family)